MAYDETGLILRLSDEVIADIRGRLDADDTRPEISEIDGWNFRRANEWVRFDACLPPFKHTRAYRRLAVGGSIIAEAQGPLLAVLTVGGTSASLGFDDAPTFAHHVVAPADDLGAVGACGTQLVGRSNELQTLTESTQTTLLADAVLRRALAERRALPLIVARSETDCSATAAALVDGPGMANFHNTVDSLVSAAKTLGSRLKITAVTIDYGAEDVSSSVRDFVQGIRATIQRILDICAEYQLPKPVVILRCDGGPDGPVRQWELAAHTAAQPTIVTGARYAEDRDQYGCLGHAGAADQAMLDAAALATLDESLPWRCPLPILAEIRGEETVVVTFLADEPICLVENASSAANFGFALSGANTPDIRDVAVDPECDRQVLIRTKGPVTEGVVLEYATGVDGGAVCDAWSLEVPETDRTIRRWALPASLRVH